MSYTFITKRILNNSLHRNPFFHPFQSMSCKRTLHSYSTKRYSLKLNSIFSISQRNVVSIREPRKKLPIEVIAIKKAVKKLQIQRSLQQSEEFVPFAFLRMIFAVTLVTYFICYMALDPDHTAELRLELRMNGWRGLIHHLFDFNFSSEYDIIEEEEDEDMGSISFKEVGEIFEDDDYEYEYIYEEIYADGTVIQKTGLWPTEL